MARGEGEFVSALSQAHPRSEYTSCALRYCLPSVCPWLPADAVPVAEAAEPGEMSIFIAELQVAGNMHRIAGKFERMGATAKIAIEGFPD